MVERSYKILLVDDEEDNLELLNRTLRQNYEIIKTTSPLEALKILSETPVDIIISDHKMAEMDGLEYEIPYSYDTQEIRISDDSENRLVLLDGKGNILKFLTDKMLREYEFDKNKNLKKK